MKYTLAFLLLVVQVCAALELPQQFVRKLNTDDLKSQVDAILSPKSTANHKDSHATLNRQLEVCTPCDGFVSDMKKKEEVQVVAGKEETGGLFKNLIGKLIPNNGDGIQQEEGEETGIIKKLLNIATRLVEPLLDMPQASEGIGIEVLLPLLGSATGDFAEILMSTKALRTEVEVNADTREVVVGFFDLIEDIITTLEGFMIDMANFLQDSIDGTVELMVGVNLGILSVIEDVLVASLDTTNDALKFVFGVSADEVPTKELQSIAADAKEFRFFVKLKDYLSSLGDDSGLSYIITATEVKLEGIQAKVTALIDNAIVTMDSTTDVTIQADVAITDPMVSICK